ncbi:MAG: type II secretion system F family protein [Polaromonas sp.]
MKFQVLVSSAQGAIRMLQMAADSETEASKTAQAQGFHVLSVKATGPSSTQAPQATASQKRWMNRRSQFDPGLFAQELGALLEAGLSVMESLQTLGSREPAAVREQMFNPMQRTLEEGQPLSVAMSRIKNKFPHLLIASVKASEYTGDMTESLRRYAQTHKRMQGLREKVVSASIYPALLTVVGVVVLIFLLGVVVPKFAGLIDSNSQQIPAASRLLMRWGTLVNQHLGWIVGALGALVTAGAFALSRGSVREWIASHATRLPLVGGYVRLYRQTQFWQTSAMLIDGGVPAPQAFGMSVKLLGSDDAQRLQKTLSQINSGHELAEAFNSAGMVDSVSYRMLKVAQKTGQLGRVLGQLAGFQNDVLERGIDRLTRLLEPMLMIVIGLAIGGIVVMMYLPIFDLASSIQ